jgi:hypothetical protein
MPVQALRVSRYTVKTKFPLVHRLGLVYEQYRRQQLLRDEDNRKVKHDVSSSFRRQPVVVWRRYPSESTAGASQYRTSPANSTLLIRETLASDKTVMPELPRSYVGYHQPDYTATHEMEQLASTPEEA